MVINSKQKGNRYERKIARLLSEAFGIKIDRTPCSGALRAKGDLCQVTLGDYSLPGILKNFTIECKNQQKLNIWAALSQSEAEADCEGRLPLLIFTRNRAEDYACVPLTVMIQLLKGELK